MTPRAAAAAAALLVAALRAPPPARAQVVVAAQPAAAQPAPDPRYAALPEITWHAVNSRESVRVRLYRADGTVDPAAVQRLAHLLRDLRTGQDSPVVPRTLQLIVRVATRFGVERVEVYSAYRTGLDAQGRRVRHEGYHSVGSAIDFHLPGVDMAVVAAYARTFAHVGVGYYPRQGFVHLDSREQSFFWENRGRRGGHGSNRRLDRGDVAARDAAWSSANDAPWDPPGAQPRLVLHPRTIPGPRRHHARRGHHRHHDRHHARPRRPLRVFSGARP